MYIGLLSDIHGNLPALEAVLSSISKRKPDCIISLGDQVNLGPDSRGVLNLLKEYKVICLHGNHERYIRSVLHHDPSYNGANFQSLHFNASLLSEEDITFPESTELEGITFCHALPGDDRFPVYDPSKALALLPDLYPDGFTHIICGHGHNPTHLQLPHLRLDSIGSVGCMDDGVPGSAPYVMLTTDKGSAALQPFYVHFDTSVMPSRFLASGMAEFCPVMARIACEQMMRGHDFLVPFVDQARILQKAKEEQIMSQETWEEMDRRFAWPDGLSSPEFWKKHRG